jgi:preprotein translocase subunit SecY
MMSRILPRFTLVAGLAVGALTILAPVASAHAEVPAVKKIAMVDM